MPNASARHINPPPLTLGEPLQTTNISSTRRRRQEQRPLEQHIDKPLRRHLWTSSDRQWTRDKLDKERADFFDTRVTGRQEIWQTIRAAVNILHEDGNLDQSAGDSGLGDLATAQSILSAAEISLPTGDLANGVYDALGNYYPLPEWVVSDPSNIVDDRIDDIKPAEIRAGADDDEACDGDGDGDGHTDNDSTSGDAERKRLEKGKAVLDVREQITVRARLSESGRDFDVTMCKSDAAKVLVKKLTAKSSVSHGVTTTVHVHC